MFFPVSRYYFLIGISMNTNGVTLFERLGLVNALHDKPKSLAGFLSFCIDHGDETLGRHRRNKLHDSKAETEGSLSGLARLIF